MRNIQAAKNTKPNESRPYHNLSIIMTIENNDANNTTDTNLNDLEKP